jgi:hypothetical protein
MGVFCTVGGTLAFSQLKEFLSHLSKVCLHIPFPFWAGKTRP